MGFGATPQRTSHTKEQGAKQSCTSDSVDEATKIQKSRDKTPLHSNTVAKATNTKEQAECPPHDMQNIHVGNG